MYVGAADHLVSRLIGKSPFQPFRFAAIAVLLLGFLITAVLGYCFESTSGEKWLPLITGSGILLSLLFFGVVSSLSKAHAAAEASQREEFDQREHLRVALSSIGDGVISTDANGKIIFMNVVAETLTGWQFSEAQMKPLHQVLHILNRETREAAWDTAQPVLAEQRASGLPDYALLVSRDGTERLVSHSMAPIQDNRASTPGAALVLHEVTEQERSRQALQESEARATGILQSALDAIVTSNEKSEVIEWNPAAEHIFGYSRNEVLGRPMEELIIPPPLRSRHRKGMEHYIATGEARVLGRRIEITAMRKGGQEFPVELAISRLALEGPAIFTAHVRDITERKQTEAALREAQEQLKQHATNLEQLVAERTEKLQEVIGELEAFSYSISHDMRAPLRAIEGIAQALMEDYGEKLEAEGSGYLKRMMTAAVRMDQLIQDVLSYSRVVRTDIKTVPVDLDRLVINIVSEYPDFQPPKAEVIIHSPLFSVMGQEASLTQCLSNLLGNAVKFVAPGITPRVEIWTEMAGEHVRLYIRDNGVGIEPRHRDRIFMIFERVHPETEFPGTGIGLAIVKKGVERMGGTVEVDSEPGKGTTFCLQLMRAI